MRQKGFSIICLLALLVLPAAAWAQQKGAVELTSKAEVELVTRNAKGEKEVKRVEAAKANVAPGDEVVFTVEYANHGKKPADNVVIKNPVPEHMVYTDKSAEGKGTKIDFSVDKGKTYATPDKLTVKSADGKERSAVASDYTHIRWTLTGSVPAGGKGSVSFRAKVK